MAIQLYYNKTTYQLIGIDDNSESIVVGDTGVKEFQFYFGTGVSVESFVNDATIPATYLGRVIIERPDGVISNELYLTPMTGSGQGYYKLIIDDWVSAAAGNLGLTVRLKLSDGNGGYTTTNYTEATIVVEPGSDPGDDTIEDAQYQAIMDAVDGVVQGTTDIAYDNTISELTAVTVKEAVDEIDDNLDTHIADLTNPHEVTQTQVGLGNVDNTSDLDKPVSTAQQAALDLKADITYVDSQDDAQDLRLDDLETFQTVTVPATYETKADADLESIRVDQKIATDISTHNTAIDAHTDIRALISALQGAFVYRGLISNTSTEIEADKTLLDARILVLKSRTAVLGDVLIDTDNNEWYYDGDSWENTGQAIIGLASAVNDGLMTSSQFTKLYDLYTKAQLDSKFSDYYTAVEVDALLDQLKAIYGWEDSLLGTLATTQTILNSAWSGYDYIILQTVDATSLAIASQIIAVGDLVENADITLSDASTFVVGATSSTFTGTGKSLKVIGLKVTPISAELVTYDPTDSELVATNVQDAIDELVENINKIAKDYKEYGIREVVGQSSSDFERVTRLWEEIKIGSATGLVANVSIDDADASNSFDYIEIFKRDVVNIDATDLSSNTVSNTFVKVPKFYIKEEWATEDGTDYHYIFMSQFKHDGYRLPLPFQREDGSERDYTYIGAYEAFLDGNNKLRSLTGQIPKVSYSRNNFRTAARALDGLGVNSKYQITDLAEYVDLVQIPFMIEFATKHSQGVFSGATSMAYSASHTAIADGTGVNAIVVSNATGANFVLGQTVSIGTSNSNDSIAKDRIVTQIDVDTPNAGETTITFDGAAVNIAIGNVVASRAWKTGMTDSVKVSGTHALNDGKHSIVWRGLENPFGNIWKNVDGVKISNWRGYVAENPKDYNDTASVAGVYAEPYLPLGYLNANTNNYAQELGYDANYPYAKFPISVQASSGLFFRDYYYQNTGDRTVFVGGSWAFGSGAGMFCWYLYYVLGYTNFDIGARLSYRP